MCLPLLLFFCFLLLPFSVFPSIVFFFDRHLRPALKTKNGADACLEMSVKCECYVYLLINHFISLFTAPNFWVSVLPGMVFHNHNTPTTHIIRYNCNPNIPTKIGVSHTSDTPIGSQKYITNKIIMNFSVCFIFSYP